MKSILPGAPWLIAHKSMLGINKPNKITLNGKDYVIWQNKRGEISALNNICPHMQAPLSEGWIGGERNTITCPFHALEFDSEGRLYREGKEDKLAIAETLEIVIKNDCIWTYGGFAAQIPIPDLLDKVTEGYEFIGITGEKSIQGDFLSSILVNYDYNHQNGTHKELFRIKSCRVSSFEENGYYAKVEQEAIRDKNSIAEIIKNPALGIMPKVMNNILEYSFPSTIIFQAQSPIGQIVQTHILYPETEKQTKTFILMYIKTKNPLVKLLFKNSFLEAANTVVEQDTTAVESLYPREKAKIRLPGEEVMFHAEKLYREWQSLKV